MRLAAFYAAVCLSALAGFAAVQLGWQPNFVAVWDTRSLLYLDGLFAFPAFISCMAAAAALPVDRMPRRLQALPVALTLCILSLTLVGLVQLSASSDASEIRQNLLRSIGFGVGLGLVLGIIQGFSPKEEKEDDSLSDWQRHALVIGMMAAVVLVGLFLLVQTRPRDDGKYEEFASLGTLDRHLDIGVKTAPLTDDSYGIVRISDPARSNLLVLEKSEWPTFANLWAKARGIRSTSWKAAGEAGDTVASDRATISLSGGPGVRLRISSPHSPTMTYDVTPADVPRVDAAISETGKRLDR